MTDSCGTCYFYRLYTSSRPALIGIGTCRNDAPRRVAVAPAESPWEVVNSDEWCADGKDGTTQRPFSPKAYSPVTPNGSGSFFLFNASTVNVVSAVCSPASIINAWPVSGIGLPGLRVSPNAGNFDVFTIDGSSVTGTWAYLIY